MHWNSNNRHNKVTEFRPGQSQLPSDPVADNPEWRILGAAEVICCNNYLQRGRDTTRGRNKIYSFQS